MRGPARARRALRAETLVRGWMLLFRRMTKHTRAANTHSRRSRLAGGARVWGSGAMCVVGSAP